MTWIQWCKCQRRILTTEQMNNGELCELCQKERNEKENTDRQNMPVLQDTYDTKEN